MAFNKNTIPKFNIVPGVSGDIIISNSSEETNMFYLHKKNKQLMALDTKTNREIKELYSSYDLAYGNVLVSGLGFGILPLWVASKPEVKSVKVIECSQDVINLFLESNTLPKNMTIQLGDISTFESNEKYDCILLDHFQDHLPENKWYSNLEDIKTISANIPNHNLIWGWSIEHMFLSKKFGITFEQLFIDPIDLRQFNLYLKWLEFIDKDVNVMTLPSLSKNKLTEYVYTYFNYIAIKELRDYISSLDSV
jgi:hypothetical protein